MDRNRILVAFLALCFVISTEAQTIHSDNLALFKPTGMVSIDGADNVASNAVDGWRDFRVIRKSCAVTGTSTSGFIWWYVDLQANYDVKNVILTNSAKTPGWERQKNFKIYVFDYFDGTDIWQNSFSVCNSQGAQSMEYGGVKQFPCLQKSIGRYVVILKLGTEALELCEVEVYDETGVDNIALHKPTQLYTHYYGDYRSGYLFGFRAVDGHANVMLGDKSCIRTSGGASVDKERWSVDLVREYRVRRIVVVNRGDAGTGSLFRKFHFLVAKQYHPWDWDKNHFRECYQQAIALKEAQTLEANCNYNTVGRYVLIQTDEAASTPMFICEAEVYATKLDENLALNRPTVISGEIGVKVKTSGKAVDGLVFSPFGSGTCVKSPGTDNTEWLMIDLQGLYIINYVLLFNRGDYGRCIAPMGLDARNPKIADAQMSASSELSFNATHKYYARYGRLWQDRTTDGNYAWCAGTGTEEWLQIDFLKLVLVNGIIVQGTKTPVFTRKVTVSYSEDGSTFKFLEDHAGNKIKFVVTFAQFDNMRSTWFPKELMMRKIRIHPVEWNTSPCLRVEILGCWDVGTDLKNFKIQTAMEFDENNYAGNVFKTCHHQVNRLPSASMNKLVCDTRPVARYVVAEKSPAISEALTFCELEVYGKKYDGNLAYRHPTEMNNQYRDYTSDRAVDGELDPNITRSLSCSRTLATGIGNNWWKVDLGAEFNIGWVDVISEADCCENCLNNFEIVISKTWNSSQPAGMNSTICYSYENSMPGGQLLSFQCLNETIGRYVVILHPSNVPLTLCEVRVYKAESYTLNYALGKTTDMSSIGDPVLGQSNLAVDGLQMTDYHDKSCTLTCGKMTDPWWVVNLNKELNVKKVVITNREDCCYYRMKLFQVIVAKNFIPFRMDLIDSKLCASESSSLGPGVEHAMYCGRRVVGSYIIVTKSESQNRPLTLCELQVYGETPRDNLALDKPSSLSSESSPNSAPRINDGNTDPNFNAGSCSSTKTDLPTQWWTVDLEARYVVDTIFISNAVDCCSEGMSDYRVILSDVFYSDLNFAYYLCMDVINRASRDLDFLQHHCLPGAVGQHVTFVKPNAMNQALVLCEVEVYGSLPVADSLMEIASGKTAQQSTEGLATPSAGRATDGNPSIASADCSKTQASFKSASWTVNLGGAYYIMSVDIYLPGDCCGYNRNRLALVASDTFTQVGLQAFFPGLNTPAAGATTDDGAIVLTGSNYRLCAVHDSMPPQGQIIHEICEHGTYGNFLTIVKKMTYNNNLYLCEVKVHGVPVAAGLPAPLTRHKRSVEQQEFQPIFAETVAASRYVQDAPLF